MVLLRLLKREHVYFYFSFRKEDWWKIWPTFKSTVEQEDYGMPEYALYYPWVRMTTFQIGPLHWVWMYNVDGP